MELSAMKCGVHNQRVARSVADGPLQSYMSDPHKRHAKHHTPQVTKDYSMNAKATSPLLQQSHFTACDH